MATTQANSIPSPLNPAASEYVPLSVHEKEEANIASPQIVELELPPPIDSVPRDVRIISIQKKGGESQRRRGH